MVRLEQLLLLVFIPEFPEALPLFLAPRWRLWSGNGNFALRVVISALRSLLIVGLVSGHFAVCPKEIRGTFASFANVLADS